MLVLPLGRLGALDVWRGEVSDLIGHDPRGQRAIPGQLGIGVTLRPPPALRPPTSLTPPTPLTAPSPASPAMPPPAAPCSPAARAAAGLPAGPGAGRPAGLLALFEAPLAAPRDAASGASGPGVRGGLLRLLAQRRALQVAGDQVGVGAVESLPEGLHGLPEWLQEGEASRRLVTLGSRQKVISLFTCILTLLLLLGFTVCFDGH